MKKILVVVDMQNDFVDGALGTPEAAAIVPAVAAKIAEREWDGIYVTYDTHFENYADTLEGRKLPVPHCIDGTPGHGLNAAVAAALEGRPVTEVIKFTFGSFALISDIQRDFPGGDAELEFVGLCTDICVVSNALIARAAFPDAKITVDAACCAGVSPATHAAALDVMRCCQIDVI